MTRTERIRKQRSGAKRSDTNRDYFELYLYVFSPLRSSTSQLSTWNLNLERDRRGQYTEEGGKAVNITKFKGGEIEEIKRRTFLHELLLKNAFPWKQSGDG